MLLWFEAMMMAFSFDTLIDFSLFHRLFGFVGWEEVEFYIPPQPGDDDVERALGCDYYGWE